jgi:hypothetical protein
MEPTLNHPSACAAPDWATITRDVHCPLCGYNLRGLIEPRCPECGYRFKWAALFDEYQWRHKWLFEHQPGVKSLFATLRRSIDMQPFWDAVLPWHRPRFGRMVLYWCLLAAPMLGAQALTESGAGQEYLKRNPRPGQELRFNGQETPSVAWSVVWVCATWPWIAAASLILFRRTLRRARIGAIHVVRCAIYAADMGLLLGVALVWLIWWRQHTRPSPIFPHPALDLIVLDTVLFPVLLIWLALLAYRLKTAYRVYLRFSHAWAASIWSQVVFVVLLCLITAT